MTSKVYLAMGIFSSIFTLSACQAALQSVTANQQAPIVAPVVPAVLDSDGDGVLGDIDECPQTPLHTVVDDRGCPFTLIGVGLKMEYRAFFAKDSSELSPEYQLELDKIAKKLQEYDTATMRIEGHASADEVDKKLRSNSLARNRAIIVKNYLIMQHQIDPNRLSTASYGAQRPIASSDTEEGRSMNRRVYGLAQEP